MTKLERRRELQQAAMPEVKKLVRRYGRTVITVCLSKLKEHEKACQKLAALKREVAALEKKTG